jgi:hypothetical protein
MRYTARTAQRYLPHQARARAAQIEQARQAIPVNNYLRMLHIAACTGEMPHIDPDTGAPVGTSDHIDPKARKEIIEFLVDKALPDLQRAPVIPDETPNPDDLDHAAADPSKLSSDQIRALLIAANDLKKRAANGIRDAAFTSQPESAPASG